MSEPMMACRLLTLWIGLAAPALQATGDDPPPRVLEVAVERLDVLAEPDEAAFVTGRLARSDRVEVRKTLPGGWLAISVPAGGFHWVDDSAVETLRDGRLFVTSEKTTLRLGRIDLRTPGPPRSTLLEGAVLRPARQPAMTSGEGRRIKTWRAVAPEADEVRFIREAGVVDPAAIPPTPKPQAPERRVSVDIEPAEIPPELVGPLGRIEGDHRAVIARPIEGWEFTAIRKEYQALLASQGSESSRSVVRDRIDQIDREDELAKSARTFEALVKKSRQRDVILERVKAAIGDLKAAEALAFDAEGLLQGTARRVDGEKVFSLLDDRGQVVTYLRLPTGVDAANYLTRRVGVRGKSRFNEGLRFRLLDVREIEATGIGP